LRICFLKKKIHTAAPLQKNHALIRKKASAFGRADIGLSLSDREHDREHVRSRNVYNISLCPTNH